MSFWTPQPGPQARAAICPADITMFGGSRGGGKSDCAIGRHLRGAEKYTKHWNGLIVRRKYKEFAEMRRRLDEMIANGLPATRIGGDQQTNYVRFKNGAQIIMPAVQSLQMVADHVGMQYTEITIDEGTTFPFFAAMIDKLKGSNRSAHGVPCRMFVTGNPGGPGHNQVKEYFKLGKTFGVKPETPIIDEDGQSRIFIPSFLDDNRILCENDPTYVNKLKSIRDPALRKAWLDGDWDVYIGQAFLVTDAHIIKPLPIPDYAPLYMTFDWGYGKPFSVGWWWVDGEGRIYRFAEWYGSTGMPDEGLRIVDSEIAKGIKQREQDLGIWGSERIIRLAGPDCWNKKPDYRGGGQAPSTAETFAAYGIFLSRGDPARVQKIQQFRERLDVPRDDLGLQIDRPMMQIYETCKEFIRTIPALSMDDNNPEDIDCFVAGTMVSTPKGLRPIESLTPGDFVKTPIGDRKVLKSGLAGYENTDRVFFCNGKSIEATKDHKIFIKNIGLLPVCRITSGHQLLDEEEVLQWLMNFEYLEGLNLRSGLIDRILNVIQVMQKYSGLHSFIAQSGLLNLVKYQKEGMFITKTTIPETIALKILNSFMRTIMQDNITKKELKMVAISQNLLKIGEQASGVKLFYEKILKSAVKNLPLENLRALIVANLLKQDNLQNNVVLVNAQKNIQELKRNVRYVGNCLKQKETTLKKSKLVVTNVVGSYGVKKPVYYLTVDQAHLFFAEGVLTANTEQEDHIYDEACHICQARPLKLKIPEPTKTEAQKHIEKITKIDKGDYESAYLREQAMQQALLSREMSGGGGYSDVDER